MSNILDGMVGAEYTDENIGKQLNVFSYSSTCNTHFITSEY